MSFSGTPTRFGSHYRITLRNPDTLSDATARKRLYHDLGSWLTEEVVKEKKGGLKGDDTVAGDIMTSRIFDRMQVTATPEGADIVCLNTLNGLVRDKFKAFQAAKPEFDLYFRMIPGAPIKDGTAFRKRSLEVRRELHQ